METILRIRPSLFEYFFRRLGDRPLAEDLVQETLLRAVQTMDRVPESDLRPWIFGIARRVGREARRTIRRSQRTDRRPPPSIDREPLDLGLLGREDRGLLQLKHIEGWKCREIAQAFGKSIGAVTMSLSRIYRRMRRAWSESQG